MKFTYGKATLQFFFNGIREIYSECSHPRRAEYDEKCRWKLTPLKSNFAWSTFVLDSDSLESVKKYWSALAGPSTCENQGGTIFQPVEHHGRTLISCVSMNGCRPSGPPPIEHPGRAQPSSRTGDHCTLGFENCYLIFTILSFSPHFLSLLRPAILDILGIYPDAPGKGSPGILR